MSVLNLPVLVLNQNYEPLNVCRARRAVVLLYQSKAEMLEDGVGYVHTAHSDFQIPSVIRLPYLVKRPFRTGRKLSRLEVFSRDNYSCQYCGKETRHLTLDHVIPRYRGGPHTWENLVSACHVCNRRKGGKTLQEAHMRLLRQPYEPKASYYYLFRHYLHDHAQWEKFLKGWM